MAETFCIEAKIILGKTWCVKNLLECFLLFKKIKGYSYPKDQLFYFDESQSFKKNRDLPCRLPATNIVVLIIE